MGRKSKYSFETKLAAVHVYKNNEGSMRVIAKRFHANEGTFKKWWMIYTSQGESGLLPSTTNKRWDKVTKLNAVLDYLNGHGSLKDICKKYKISTKAILKSWIKVYNSSHKELKSTGSGGNKRMTNRRKTTFDERVEIVQYCISHGKDYGATIEKYNVSYQQIYSWVKKYEAKGIDGLIDKRGKTKPEAELTDMDRLKAEMKMLEAKNFELEMENRLLKKLAEIERRWT